MASNTSGDIQLGFILYVSRSGSTMLANKIARRLENVTVYPELDFINQLFAYGDAHFTAMTAERLEQLIAADPTFKDLALTPDDLKSVTRFSPGQTLIEFIRRLTDCYAKSQGRERADCAVFQRGTTLTVVPEIIGACRNARFIHIMRDPRAAISSVIRLKRIDMGAFNVRDMGRRDARGLALNWKRYVSRVRHYEARYPDNILEVMYEEVCADLDGALHKIGQLLGARLREGDAAKLEIDTKQSQLHKHIDSAPLAERTTAWRTELAGHHGVIVESAAGQEMQERGYDPWFTERHSDTQRLVYGVVGRAQYVIASILPFLKRVRHAIRTPGATFRILRRRFAKTHPGH
ncbi:MAG: sulfotransferase [Pseudomonadota bacterium]